MAEVENFQAGGGEMAAVAVADELFEGLTELQSESSATLQGSEASSQHILDELHKASTLSYKNLFRACERQWELKVSRCGYN